MSVHSTNTVDLFHAKNTFQMGLIFEELQDFEKFRSSHFWTFCKGYSKAKWSRMADFRAELQSPRKLGKATRTMILCLFMDSRTILDLFHARNSFQMDLTFEK